MLLQLIKAHALVHRASRPSAGDRVVATLDDYTIVRELIADAFAEGIESTVPVAVRDTAAAVAELNRSGEGVG